ncbi:MAG: DMT family transporter [Bacillota bacterium]|nr:DMT family transporter [Bacillota bacterium]
MKIETNSGQRDARVALEQHELSHAKRGLFWGVISGATWGLDGVIWGMAFLVMPFAIESDVLKVIIAVSVASAAMHDGFAAFWLFWYNLFTGKFLEYLRTLKTRPGKIVCLAALFGGPIAMTGYSAGIMLAGASYSLAITAMYPAVGAIMAVFILKEKITPRVWAGILMCIVGAIIVSWVAPEGDAYPMFYLGLGLSLLATFGWGMEGVLSTYGMDMADPDIAIGIRQATSFVVYFVLILPMFAGIYIFFDAFTTSAVGYMALAGFLGAVSYLAWYRALNTTGVGRAMAFNITYALWAIVFGYLLTDIQITTNLVVGAIIITLGTILVSANPKELLNLRKV